LAVAPGYDLVYIDTPYINANGVGVDYHGFYHFLEGLVDYDRWATRIDWGSKHRRLTPQRGPWTDPSQIGAAFRTLFARFASSILVVSYRSDGTPTPQELEQQLREVKRHVTVHRYPGRKKYVLSTNGRAAEILLVATDEPQES
jgi:adenine-specific DNA methylase